MNLGQKILRNKAWLAIAVMLVLLIIFAATSWIQAAWWTWTIAILFFGVVGYALWYGLKKKKNK